MLTGIYLLLLFGFLHNPVLPEKCRHKRNIVALIDSTKIVKQPTYNTQVNALKRLLRYFDDAAVSVLVYSSTNQCTFPVSHNTNNKLVSVNSRQFQNNLDKLSYVDSDSQWNEKCSLHLIQNLQNISKFGNVSHVIFRITNSETIIPDVRLLVGAHEYNINTSRVGWYMISKIKDIICDPKHYLNNTYSANKEPSVNTIGATHNSTIHSTKSIQKIPHVTIINSMKKRYESTTTTEALLSFDTSRVSFATEVKLRPCPTSQTFFVTSSLLSVAPTLKLTPNASVDIIGDSSIDMSIARQVKKDVMAFTSRVFTVEELSNETWAEHFMSKSLGLMRDAVNFLELSTESTTKEEDVESKLIDFVENTCVKIGENLATGTTITKMDKEFGMEISTVNPQTFSGYQFPRQQSPIVIKNQNMLNLPSNLMSNLSQEKVAMVALQYQPIKVMRALNNSFTLAPTVLSVTVNAALKTPFVKPLKHSIILTKPINQIKGFQCVYWEPSTRTWLSDGCKLAYINESVVSCDCYHMTAFSVLMQINHFEIPIEDDLALTYISYIGCSVSVISCFCLVAVYLWKHRLLQNDRNVIHVNLAAAIALSNGLFLAADFAHTKKKVCEGVSVSLLYFLTATLLWMLIEGIHVYFMIVKVFRSDGQKKNLYMAFGWIVPAALPAVIAIEFRSDLIRPHFCWITTTVIWLFVGPALFVIIVNTVVLVLTLCKASHKHGSDTLELKRIARLTLLLLPLFGISWLLGVFALNSDGMLFQYAFTILNSLQGFFVFIGYCVCNSEVRNKRHLNYSKTQNYKKSSMESLGMTNHGSTNF